ncbi:hypothetical protein HELRODRAFT_191832 [Helobdella robusta]|uniref:Uncharacterized protein n=1 Tax=Helobdella robusta TaxID=6412 RepID=T1FTC4_HELRO|nr:hypothetical protein HELRODRAFT_191832 [Helobdella robusta]ESO03995.1 hypothetical protein HELRODRAFT_191832 [Helobdella robusta]
MHKDLLNISVESQQCKVCEVIGTDATWVLYSHEVLMHSSPVKYISSNLYMIQASKYTTVHVQTSSCQLLLANKLQQPAIHLHHEQGKSQQPHSHLSGTTETQQNRKQSHNIQTRHE